MRHVSVAAVLLLCAVLSIPACKATTTKGGVDGSFDSPAEQVSALIDQGQIVKASEVVVNQEAFFAGSFGDPNVKAVLDRLKGALDYKYSPQMAAIRDRAEAVAWPVAVSGWPSVRTEMDDIAGQLDELSRVAIFKYPQYRPTAFESVVRAVKVKENRIGQDAPKAFSSYPLANGQNFFDAYPIKPDPAAFMRENESVWTASLASMTAEQKKTFLNTYGGNLPDSAQKEMAKQYFLSMCPNPRTASIKDILEAYHTVRAAGLELESIPDVKVGFLQVTSPDLIKDKALDFGINVKLDMPFDASKASMRKAFNHAAVKEADVLILMNVAVSKAKRVVERQEAIPSTYVASYVDKENPEYEIAKAELEAASQQHHAAKNKSTTTWAQDILVHWIEESQKKDAITDTEKRLTETKEKLRNTPKYISVANYQPYQVTKAHMDIYKFATVNYYVVDKRKKTFFRDTFDVQEKAFFTVCYAMADSDPNREQFLQESVLEEDVVRYELEPAAVNLSDLLEQFSQRPNEWKRYADMGTVHRTFTKDRSAAQLKRKDETFTYDKYADKRFDSVVVVRNTGSGIGTGFYVTDEMIITNYHVVEESNYVQLKLFNEREIMGRVIARDAQLDLALIQADVRGKPVCFYNKRELPLGETLEVIGHPDGLEFSISRGVISSIRKTPPINFRESNRDVLYIQTDAASNGGNSGGPVFYGDYVVGVHDWGVKRARSGVAAQGLNFSIHYSEVFSFLDHNGIRVCKRGK